MPALVTYRQNEVFLYTHRQPGRGGKNSSWLWPILDIFFAAFFSLVLLGLFISGTYSLQPVYSSILAVIYLFTILRLVGFPRKIIISFKDQTIYRGFLFFRRRVAGFDEISKVRLEEAGMGKLRTYRYVAVLTQDPLGKPIHLTPLVNNHDKLAAYHRPLYDLSQALAAQDDDDEPEEVLVECVENVNLLPASADSESILNATIDGFPGQSFINSDIVESAVMAAIVISFAYGLRVLLGPYSGMLYQMVPVAALILLFLIGIVWGRSNSHVSYDRANRVVHYRTWFGRKKYTVGFDDFEKIEYANAAGYRTMQMRFKGVKVPIGILATFNAKKAEAAIREICGILGVDPRKYL